MELTTRETSATIGGMAKALASTQTEKYLKGTGPMIKGLAEGRSDS